MSKQSNAQVNMGHFVRGAKVEGGVMLSRLWRGPSQL